MGYVKKKKNYVFILKQTWLQKILPNGQIRSTYETHKHYIIMIGLVSARGKCVLIATQYTIEHIVKNRKTLYVTWEIGKK